jgi:PKD domain-containing protein/Big-like domain-containing protein
MFSIITGRSASRNLVVWAALTVGALVAGCNKVPLLAPSLSTITLSSTSTIVQSNSTAQVSATVLKQPGTIVQDGTTVTFTTTLGTLSPTVARTMNGVATTTFSANGQSGVAEIRATSGGAKPADTANPSLKLTVGGAAAARVLMTASPSRVPATGGSSTITATVSDTNGNALTGVTVAFTTDNGTVSNTVATTNSSGQAITTLTTTQTATVTATVGASGATAVTPGTVKVTVTVLPDIAIAVATGSTLSAGQIVTFTVTVTPGSATDVFQSLVVNFGDGSSTPTLGGGSTSVSHTFNAAGTYTVTATGTTASGDTKPASTVIVIQPVLVNLSVSKSTLNPLTATFTATVNPSGTAISNYHWSFGDGQSLDTSNNTTTHTYAAGATYTASVTVTTPGGQTASSSTSFTMP